jgi:acyl-homoserine-lactone acylase
MDPRMFPPELTPNINGMRQQISLEMLENHNGRFRLEHVLQQKYNTRMLLADRVKSDVVKHLRGQTVDGVDLTLAADVLHKWDNTASKGSEGALLFERFWRKYGAKAMKPYAEPWNELRPITTPAGIGEPDTVRETMAATIKEMKERYGRIDVPWGEVHRLRRGKLDLPVGGLAAEFRPFRGARMGDFGTFRIIQYDEDQEGKFIARGGDSFVLAVEFTSPPTAYTVLAYSQSEDPNSPHHTDQTVLFAEEKWKRACFTEEDIAKNLSRSYRP